MSQVGKKMPEFVTNGYNPKKEEFVTVSNKDFEGKWNVLMFYPADFTFVCPTELEDARSICKITITWSRSLFYVLRYTFRA